MKQLFLIATLGFSLIGFSQKSAQTTITFNHLQSLSNENKTILNDIFYGMGDHKYHTFNLVDLKDKSNYQYPRLLAIAKQRALVLQNYYISEQGVNPKNVKISYGGEFPTLLLHKPKALYIASGEINLEDKYQQCYNYNSAIDNNIYVNSGNTFIFPPNAFETLDGKPVSASNIDICIWEFTDKKSLIYANLTTHAGDRMLETGGAFFIKASLNGEELRLVEGTKYTVKMLAETNHNDMFTYYGNTKDDIIDWEVNKSEPAFLSDNNSLNPSPQVVMIEDEFGDPTIEMETWEDESEGDQTFYQLSAGKLGWINCDRFYDAPNTSPLMVKVDSKEPLSVRIVFRDINSVLPCYTSSNHKDVYTAKNIPTGEKVLLMAYSVKGDNAVLGYKEIVIGENDSETITLNNLSKRRFEGAVSELLSY